MHMYLCTKFQVSSIILTSFRQGGGMEGGGVVGNSPPTSKRTPKKATDIGVKELCNNLFKFNQIKLCRILHA